MYFYLTPVILFIFISTIGLWIRSARQGVRPNRFRIAICFVSSMLALFTIWCAYRSQYGDAYDGLFPREFPYPDKLVVALAEWYAPTTLDTPRVAAAMVTFVIAAGVLSTISLCVSLIPSIRRHLPDNACPSCSYDLTGNTTGTCPECGNDLTTTGTDADVQ